MSDREQRLAATEALEEWLRSILRAGKVDAHLEEDEVKLTIDLAGAHAEITVRGSIHDPATMKSLRQITTAFRPRG